MHAEVSTGGSPAEAEGCSAAAADRLAELEALVARLSAENAALRTTFVTTLGVGQGGSEAAIDGRAHLLPRRDSSRVSTIREERDERMMRRHLLRHVDLGGAQHKGLGTSLITAAAVQPRSGGGGNRHESQLQRRGAAQRLLREQRAATTLSREVSAQRRKRRVSHAVSYVDAAKVLGAEHAHAHHLLRVSDREERADPVDKFLAWTAPLFHAPQRIAERIVSVEYKRRYGRSEAWLEGIAASKTRSGDARAQVAVAATAAPRAAPPPLAASARVHPELTGASGEFAPPDNVLAEVRRRSESAAGEGGRCRGLEDAFLDGVYKVFGCVEALEGRADELRGELQRRFLTSRASEWSDAVRCSPHGRRRQRQRAEAEQLRREEDIREDAQYEVLLASGVRLEDVDPMSQNGLLMRRKNAPQRESSRLRALQKRLQLEEEGAVHGKSEKSDIDK